MSQTLDGKRVLIVDDDNDILHQHAGGVRSRPARLTIDTANNGNKAVEHWRKKHQPDLVVLDMMLPGRSGFLVLEKIKARKPRNTKPHVIMVTGQSRGRGTRCLRRVWE